MISNNFLAGSLALVLFGSLAAGGQSATAWLCGIPERAAQQKLAENAAFLTKCANHKRVHSDPRFQVLGCENDIWCDIVVADTASTELRERRAKRDDSTLWVGGTATGTISSASQPWPIVDRTKRKTRRRQ